MISLYIKTVKRRQKINTPNGRQDSYKDTMDVNGLQEVDLKEEKVTEQRFKKPQIRAPAELTGTGKRIRVDSQHRSKMACQ